MPYPPEVERWRPLVSQYFKPEDVDKALYVINYESGGNAAIKAAGTEPSWGLFQMNQAGGLGQGFTAQQLQDPETNVKLAAQAVYGGSGWRPWGEGVTYKGEKFGALGNHPYPTSSGRGFTAPPPPGGKMATPQQEDVARKYFEGASYGDLSGPEQGFVDNKVRSLYGVEGLTGPQPSASAVKPDGFIEYDDAGNPFRWQNGQRVAAPDAPPQRNSTVNPPTVVVQNQPVSTSAAMSEDQIRASVQKQGGKLSERGGIFIATWPDGSTTTYDPTGFPRDGSVTYNPTYKAAAASTTAAPKKSIAQLAYENAGNVGGNKAPAEGGDAQAATATKSPETAPIPSGGNQYGDPSSPNYNVTGNPMIGQDVYAPADIFGNKGQIAGSWVPTQGGGSMFLTPQNAASISSAAYGTDPSSDPMKDLTGGAAAIADRALLSSINPSMSPTQIQSRFFDVPGGFDRQREAQANAALSQAGNLLKPPAPEEPGVTYPFDPIMGFAEGGSVTVGTNPEEDLPWPAGKASSPPRIGSASGMISRDYEGQRYTMPLTGGGYRPADTSGLSGLFQRYINEPWGGQHPNASSILADEFQHYFPIWLRGQGAQFRNMPGGGSWDWQGTDAPTASIGGKTYRFADGGGMMLNEPVVGMGMQSGQPKFLAGEAGPEHLQFTPANQMQAPVPQGNTDPRIMSLFAQTAAQRMRPRVPIP